MLAATAAAEAAAKAVQAPIATVPGEQETEAGAHLVHSDKNHDHQQQHHHLAGSNLDMDSCASSEETMPASPETAARSGVDSDDV